MTIINKIKAVILGIAALFLYLWGYKSANNKQKAEVLDNVKQAKKSRDSLNNPKRIKRLHNKYKR